MTERDQHADAERLPEETARRVLARASELDAARGAELSVADLREAAREAGIAPKAFEQALAELRAVQSTAGIPVLTSPAGPHRRRWLLPAALLPAALLVMLLIRLVVPAP